MSETSCKKAASFLAAIFLLTSLPFLQSTSSQSFATSHSHVSYVQHCKSCNISALSDETFTHRYLSGCLVCGEFYGSAVEHCCMCYQRWFEDCRYWTGFSTAPSTLKD